MVSFKEPIKGVLTFLLVSLFFYFAWSSLFNGFLTLLINTSSYLGVFGWASFIGLWVFTAPVFLFYSIAIGSKGGVTTKPLEIFKGIGAWGIAMTLLMVIWLVFFGNGGSWGGFLNMIDTFPQNGTISSFSDGSVQTWDATADFDAQNGLWSLAVLVLLTLTTCVPFYWITKGYGIDIIK